MVDRQDRSAGNGSATYWRRFVLRAPVTVGLALSAHGAAHAQAIASELRASVAVLHDDNLLRDNRTRSLSGTGDTRITPSLYIDLRRSVGRNTIYLKGDAGYDFYRRNNGLDAERIGLRGGGRLALGARCAVDAGATVDFRQSDVADLGEVRSNVSRRQTYEMLAQCPRPAGLYPSFSVQRTVTDNGSAQRSLFDLRSYEVGVAAVYARPSLGLASLFYSHAEIDRPGAALFLGTSDTIKVDRIGLRLEREVAARIGGKVALMGIRTRPELRTTPSFTGIGYEGQLSYRPFPALDLTAMFSRDVRGESSFGAAYLIAQATEASLTYRVGARTTLGAGGTIARRRLRGENQLFGLPPRIADRTFQVGLTAAYDLTPAMRLTADAGYSRRTSPNNFYDFTSRRAGLRLSYRL